MQGGPVWRSPSFVIHHISSLCNQNNSSKAEHPSSISVCDQLSIRCQHGLPYRFKIVHMNALVGMIPNCQVNGSPAGRTEFCRNNAFQQAFLSGKLLHRQIPGQCGWVCQQIVPTLSAVICPHQDAGVLFAASQKNSLLLTKEKQSRNCARKRTADLVPVFSAVCGVEKLALRSCPAISLAAEMICAGV